MWGDWMSSDFLIRFHQEHFAGTDAKIYSKEVFYKLLEELSKIDADEDRQ